MSFIQYKKVVEAGDTLFVYLSHKQIYPLLIKSGEVFQTKYGALKHDSLIGRCYGDQVQCSKGYVHILHPTPELWTANLPHRTQILYSTDISVVITYLDLRPSSVVFEAGTGSGSLSHAIARTIAPDGKLYTFDFHEERVAIAREEFKVHGIDHIVQCDHRDVCSDGFGLSNVADALFLDLPHPWQATVFAKETLKAGGRFCSFSPCIEQVQKCCAALRANGFADIETFECHLRPYEVKQISMPVFDFSSSSNEKAGEAQEAKNEAGRSGSIEVEKKEAEMKEDDDNKADDHHHATKGENVMIAKKRKGNNDVLATANSNEYSVALPLPTPGHTGFLTFATKQC